jgi:hypothetical protein
MSDDGIDFGPLSSRVDRAPEDRVVAAVMRRITADPLLESDVMTALYAWSRPTLVAASLVTSIGAGIVVALGQQPTFAPRTVAESAGVPPAIARWIAGSGLETGLLMDEMRGPHDH